MVKIIKLAIYIVLAIAPGFAVAGNAELREAEHLYKEGRYEEAAGVYDSVLRSDGSSAQLLFNLGNTYVKLDKLGDAMVCYKKARMLSPGNATVRRNLLYIESKIRDRNRALLKDKNQEVEPAEKSFLSNIEEKIAWRTSADTWGTYALVSFALLLAALSIYFFTTGVTLRKIGFFGAIVLLCFTILFNIFAFVSKHYWQQKGECVIMVHQAQLHEKPDESSPSVASPLVAGTVVMADDSKPQSGSWIKVSLNSTFTGYIPEKDVARL